MADSLDAILNKPRPAAAAADEDDCGPCAAIAKSRLVTALTLRHAAGPWESFQYRGITTRSTYTPASAFTVSFVEEDATYRVTVTGRNLGRIYNLVLQHRMEWLRTTDRDFADDGQQVITGIRVERIDAKR